MLDKVLFFRRLDVFEKCLILLWKLDVLFLEFNETVMKMYEFI